MPLFFGSADEDVNDLLVMFNRTAAFYGLSNKRKLELLLLLEKGNAFVWLNTSTHFL